jgi:hypothetical protein
MTSTGRLREAARAGTLVRFSTRFEKPLIHGYILDVGPRFFLLALVSDRIWFDGFECFRVGDVRGFKPHPRAVFVEAALKQRHERRPKAPRVDMANIAGLLLSAARAFPLVAIHRERINPDVCHIGSVVRVDRGSVLLLEINPDATWDQKPTEYRLNEITRVNFGGDYENALTLVGGVLPPG